MKSMQILIQSVRLQQLMAFIQLLLRRKNEEKNENFYGDGWFGNDAYFQLKFKMCSIFEMNAKAN